MLFIHHVNFTLFWHWFQTDKVQIFLQLLEKRDLEDYLQKCVGSSTQRELPGMGTIYFQLQKYGIGIWFTLSWRQHKEVKETDWVIITVGYLNLPGNDDETSIQTTVLVCVAAVMNSRRGWKNRGASIINTISLKQNIQVRTTIPVLPAELMLG